MFGKVLGSIPFLVICLSRKHQDRPRATWFYTLYLHVPRICIWNTGLRMSAILVRIVWHLQAPLCGWLEVEEKTKTVLVILLEHNGEDQTKQPGNPHESLSLSQCCHILARIYGCYVNNSPFNTGRCSKGTIGLVIWTWVVIGRVWTGGSTFFSPPNPSKRRLFDSHITRPGAISAWGEVLHFSTRGAQRRLG
jgi:hypothetical protein